MWFVVQANYETSYSYSYSIKIIHKILVKKNFLVFNPAMLVDLSLEFSTVYDKVDAFELFALAFYSQPLLIPRPAIVFDLVQKVSLTKFLVIRSLTH